MKKEMINLLNSKEGRLKINQYFTLERHTKNALNQDVDELNLECNLIHTGYEKIKIKSRDFEGIKKEILIAISNIMDEVRNKLLNDFSNGYLK